MVDLLVVRKDGLQNSVDAAIAAQKGVASGIAPLDADSKVPAVNSRVVSVTDVSGALNKAGDTMTGPLVLAADPVSALQPVTKQMLDSTLTGGYISINRFVAAVVDRPNPADRNTWDWTPAIVAGLAEMRLQARLTTVLDAPSNTKRYEGMPTLFFPNGVYRNTATHNLHYMHSFAIVGDEGAIIQHESANYLFDLKRCQKWRMEGFTARMVKPSATGVVKGMAQGSGFMRLSEFGADTYPAGGNTLEYEFRRLKIREFHRAFRFDGNQMLDNAVWYDCKFHDNFIDFDYQNGQAVNHHVYGGETYYGVSFPLADYQTALSSWTGLSWTGVAWHPYDGAEYWIKAGGQVSTLGGHKIINKARYHVDEILPGDDVGVGTPGTLATSNGGNVLEYYEYNVRYEMRTRDATPPTIRGRQMQRITMIRYTNPSPPDAGGIYRARVGFAFDRSSWNMQDGSAAAPIRLFHLANHVTVEVTCVGEAILSPDRASIASYLNNETREQPAVMRAKMPLLLVERLTTDQWTLDVDQGVTAKFVGHDIYIEDSRSRNTINFAPTSGVAHIYRSLRTGRGYPTLPYVASGATSVLPGAGGSPASYTLGVGKNANVKSISVARNGAAVTGTLTYTFAYTNIFGIAQSFSLTINTSTQTVVKSDIEDFVGQNGVVTVTCTNPTASTIFGYAEVLAA